MTLSTPPSDGKIPARDALHESYMQLTSYEALKCLAPSHPCSSPSHLSSDALYR